MVRSGSPAPRRHPGARRLLGIALSPGGIRLACAIVNVIDRFIHPSLTLALHQVASIIPGRIGEGLVVEAKSRFVSPTARSRPYRATLCSVTRVMSSSCSHLSPVKE